MKGKLTLAALAVAAIAASTAMGTASTAKFPADKTGKPPRPAAKSADQPIIATPSPTPITILPLPLSATPAGQSARSGAHLSSFVQYVQLGLDRAPAGRIAPIAVIDTAVAGSGRAFGGRVSVQRGFGGASANEHGSLITAAVTASYSAAASSNGGAATPARVLFYGCALAGGIDLDCSLQSLRSASASGVRVVNLSFETRADIPTDVAESWRVAVAEAAARGVLVVAAAGDAPGLPFPARVPGVVSVSRIAMNGKVVNPAATTSAPGSNLAVANANGTLVATSGSSYSTAYVSSIAARLAGAKPALTAGRLRYAVAGRVTMPGAAARVGVPVAGIARPGCVRVRYLSGGRRQITWGRAARAVRYSVRVGTLPTIVARNSHVTRLAGRITVQGVGAYGTLGPAARGC